MPPPFCGISATRGYMGAIMLYIRGFRLFPGKSAACFRNCAARSGGPAALLIYKEAPCTLEGFCPLTNRPSAHTERSPDPPTGRGALFLQEMRHFVMQQLLRDCPLSSHCGQIRLHTPPQKEICIFILFLFFFGCIKNASYYSFSRHKRLNLPNSPHIFCMEAHSSHSYSL